MDIQPADLALARLAELERSRGDKICMTQPMGNGALREYTWAEAIGESRRMATWLRAQGYPEGSNIAIISKNCAHWAAMRLGYLDGGAYFGTAVSDTHGGLCTQDPRTQRSQSRLHRQARRLGCHEARRAGGRTVHRLPALATQ